MVERAVDKFAFQIQRPHLKIFDKNDEPPQLVPTCGIPKSLRI